MPETEVVEKLGIDEVGRIAHETAIEKGWWEEKRSPLELAALVHSEVSEFVEDMREPEPKWGEDGIGFELIGMGGKGSGQFVDQIPPGSDPKDWKPVGPAVELADVLIRIGDMAKSLGFSLENATAIKLRFNKTRPIRHGGKKY